MAQEIERKFLVASDAWRAEAKSATRIVQGYLSSNSKATIRVRLMDDSEAVVTIKGPVSGITRSEFEYAIPISDAHELLEIARPHVVTKTRHIVAHDGLTWEIDVFEGLHQGLVVAEVELESDRQHVPLPDWIGLEVSDDDRYANASLSRDPGVPSRSRDLR